MVEPTRLLQRQVKHIPRVLLLACYLAVVLRTAWVSDDAFITLRTVSNFVGGYGLTWNIAERVQAYTHPLWMFVLSAGYALTREPYYTTIAISVLASLAAFALASFSVEKPGMGAWAVLAALIFSRAYVDYSTSGLENPLSHLLLAAFILILFLPSKHSGNGKRILWASLIAGLAVTNRLDTILIFLPALALLVWREPGPRSYLYVLAGLIPIMAWEVFSIIYYGFPFPNTYYAKLNLLITHNQLLRQGVHYYFNSLNWDPLTLLLIAAGLVLATLRGDPIEKALAAGASLYLGYVAWIGGDFMSGRFFSVPLLLAVMLIMRHMPRGEPQVALLILSLVAIAGMSAHFPTLTAPDPLPKLAEVIDAHGIADERLVYYKSAALVRLWHSPYRPNNIWVRQGVALSSNGPTVVAFGNVGYLGYFSGADVQIVDWNALAEPLLARLPFSPKEGKWRIGHFKRELPDGYLQTLETGTNQIANPALAEYNDKLEIITRGPLWSIRRLETILKMNTGQYDYLLAVYLSR